MSRLFRSSSAPFTRSTQARADVRKQAEDRNAGRAWRRSADKKTRKTLLFTSLTEMHRAGAAFLILDLQAALTLLNSAELVPAKRTWAYTNARNAYDSVLRLRGRLRLTIKEREALDTLIATLKARLEKEGYL